MTTRYALLFAALAALAALASCMPSHDHYVIVEPSRLPRPVSIQVEVYDPATNSVWENVSVRIAEADQEWSNSTWVSPYEDWYLTDRDGLVYLDEYAIAAAEVGFDVDSTGAAVLGPRSFEDEATVWLEIDAVGFTPVWVEVPLSWSRPDAFVSVPFN